MPNRPNKKPRHIAEMKRLMSLPRRPSRKVAGINAIKEPGDYCFMHRGESKVEDKVVQIYELACLLPRHTKPSGIIVLKTDNVVGEAQHADHVWNWNGDEDKPTLNPRISSDDVPPGKKGWKGWLIDGAFVEI